ncbi:MAG: hypothetical protein LBD03_07895 [Methanobrevibacter sp.]|nr:hypothetical protein [Candidatus Methanovirga procula]
MKINKYLLLLGLISITIAVCLFFSDTLDQYLRSYMCQILMGSSKGKDIIFFGIIALFLILQSLFSDKIDNFSKSGNYYLKIAIFITIIAIIIPLSLEVIMRLNLGLNIFTTFIIPDPNFTSTSLLHSHIFKSVIGNIITSVITNIPSGIHTASSLTHFVPWIANVIVIILPVLFLTSFLSLKDRLTPSKILLVFSLTCLLIGIVDGNLFASPTIIGIYFALLVFFDEMYFDYIFSALFKNKKMLNCFIERREKYRLKKKKSKFKAIFKRTIPHIVLILIVISEVGLAFVGSNQNYGADYEVDLIEPNINSLNLSNLSFNLDDFEVKSFIYEDNKLKIKLNSKYPDKILISELAKVLSNKTKGFSLSWNIYLWLH